MAELALVLPLRDAFAAGHASRPNLPAAPAHNPIKTATPIDLHGLRPHRSSTPRGVSVLCEHT
jgi:hypothetical protein